VSRIDVAALIENCFLVGHAVAVGVFQNQNAVAFDSLRIVAVGEAAIVDDFAHPNTAEMIDIDIRWTQQHRFGGKQFSSTPSVTSSPASHSKLTLVDRNSHRFHFNCARVAGSSGAEQSQQGERTCQ
jgi:hypothetical protein